MEFKDELEKILNNRDILLEIQKRGPPGGITWWGGRDTFAIFEKELEVLITHFQKSEYSIKVSDFWKIVRYILYEHVKDINPKRDLTDIQVEEISKDLLEKTQISETEYVIIYEIHNAIAPSDKILIRDIEFGRLEQLTPHKKYKTLLVTFPQIENGAFAKVRVQSPNEKLASDKGYYLVEQALDALFSGVPRLLSWDKRYVSVTVGVHYGFISEDQKIRWMLNRKRLIQERPFNITKELWKSENHHNFHAPAHPWDDKSLSAEIQNLLWAAYCQMGRAYRKLFCIEDALIWSCVIFG